MNEDEIGDLVSSAVQQGIKEALLTVGLDSRDPIALQRDFQFVRDLRKTSDSIRSKAILTTVGFVVTGIVAVVWLGIRAILRTP